MGADLNAATGARHDRNVTVEMNGVIQSYRSPISIPIDQDPIANESSSPKLKV
jgi:hypothetical protein